MGEEPVEFHLLGPIEATACGQVIPLGTPKQRALLAALIVDAGTPVLPDTLIDRVWGNGPPRVVRNALYSYATRIRQMLTETDGSTARLDRRSGGYVLDVDLDQIDIFRWRTLVETGRDPDRDDKERIGALREALSLWRGEPLAGIDGEWADQIRYDLSQQRLAVLIAWGRLELDLGNYDRVIDTIAPALTRHPLVETLAAIQMQALFLAGRAAEALNCYAVARHHLTEELGTEPGQELRDVHEAILRGQTHRLRPSKPDAAVPVPRQLPADISAFTGRVTELATLDSLLTSHQGPRATVVVSTVSGTAGVGKTALAIRWAHRVLDRFADGQLYIDLRGYDIDQPLTALEALAAMLRSLGVEGSAIPHELSERAALYRTLTAGRSLLVVLDNAAKTEQVRHLLPGGSSCAVIITSRDRMAALVARHGAHRLDLDLLPTSEALELLGALVGNRVWDDRAAAVDLAERCARLPLALRIAAEFLSANPQVTPRLLADQLLDERRRLDLLDAEGEERTAVRAVLSWSYRCLNQSDSRAFRLLGLHPGNRLDSFTTAALLRTELREAQETLTRLTRFHLIQQFGSEHFGMHDLLRAYARECANTESTSDRHLATRKLLDYYVVTSAEAMYVHAPYDGRHPHTREYDGPVPHWDGSDDAKAWYDANRENLIAAIRFAVDRGSYDDVAIISAALWRYFEKGGHHSDALGVNQQALTAAIRSGDRGAEAGARRRLAVVNGRLGQYEQAIEQAGQALMIYRETGNSVGVARALNNLGAFNWQIGRFAKAKDHLTDALAIVNEAGNNGGTAVVLGNLGELSHDFGNYNDAIRYSQQALDLFDKIGDRAGAGRTLSNLGAAFERLGDYETALSYCARAVEMITEAGMHAAAGQALSNLASVHHHLGRYTESADTAARALAASKEVGDLEGQAAAWHVVGMTHEALRQGREAVEAFGEALNIATRTGDRARQASALNGLGDALLIDDQPRESLIRYHAAIAVAREIGDRFAEAHALDGVARVAHHDGDTDLARSNWQESLAIYLDLDVPEAAQVSARLGAV